MSTFVRNAHLFRFIIINRQKKIAKCEQFRNNHKYNFLFLLNIKAIELSSLFVLKMLSFTFLKAALNDHSAIYTINLSLHTRYTCLRYQNVLEIKLTKKKKIIINIKHKKYNRNTQWEGERKNGKLLLQLKVNARIYRVCPRIYPFNLRAIANASLRFLIPRNASPN